MIYDMLYDIIYHIYDVSYDMIYNMIYDVIILYLKYCTLTVQTFFHIHRSCNPGKLSR